MHIYPSSVSKERFFTVKWSSIQVQPPASAGKPLLGKNDFSASMEELKLHCVVFLGCGCWPSETEDCLCPLRLAPHITLMRNRESDAFFVFFLFLLVVIIICGELRFHPQKGNHNFFIFNQFSDQFL